MNRQSTDIVTVINKLQFSSFSLHRRLKFCELFNHCSSVDFHTSMNDSENVKTFPQNSPRSICINAEQNWSVGRRTSSSGEWLIIEMDFEDLQLKVCRFRASESLEIIAPYESLIEEKLMTSGNLKFKINSLIKS